MILFLTTFGIIIISSVFVNHPRKGKEEKQVFLFLSRQHPPRAENPNVARRFSPLARKSLRRFFISASVLLGPRLPNHKIRIAQFKGEKKEEVRRNFPQKKSQKVASFAKVEARVDGISALTRHPCWISCE